MNKKKKWFYSIIAKSAGSAVMSVNEATCYYIFHQPEVPQEAKNFKLRKK